MTSWQPYRRPVTVPTTVTREQLVEAMEQCLAWVRDHPVEAALLYGRYTYGDLDYVAGIDRKYDARAYLNRPEQ